VLLAAIWISPDGRWKPDLTDLRVLGKFVLFGVLLAPLVSAAALAVFMAVFESRSADPLMLTDWFVGDSIGIGIMTPLILAVHKQEVASIFRKEKLLETIALLVGLTVLSVMVFGQTRLPIIFLMFPPLLLVIFRLGISGSAIGVFLMAVPAACFTMYHRGPFMLPEVGSVANSVLLLRCFFLVSLVTVYSVATALAERDRLAMELATAYRVSDADAAIDLLTGLATRRTFDLQLALEWKRAIREQASLSMLMIGIDHFKPYNDHYGREAGDTFLKMVASILTKAPLRASDLAARYGGEQFALILPGAGRDGSRILAEHIRQTVADANLPHFVNQPGIATISVGVATVGPTQDTNETLLVQRADEALFHAKLAGRNQVEVWHEQISSLNK
jgi:diguanylate cyclase (GGDEF)-like protein